MHVSARFMLVAALALVSVAAPAQAAAATPDFVATAFDTALGKTADVELDFTMPPDNAAVARIVIYVPQGYGVDTGVAAGTPIGQINASASAGGSTLPLQGEIVADNPANYTSLPQAQACAPGVHAAVWAAKAGNLTIPIYVDPTSGAETALGAYRLQTCLASPDIPESAGGAPFGARLSEADLDFPATVFTNPGTQGAYRWKSIVTPFTSGTGTPNAAGTYELRSVVPLPTKLTLKKVSYNRRTKLLVIGGQLVVLGQAATGVPLLILGSSDGGQTIKSFGTVKTDKKGHFSLRRKITKGMLFLAFIPESDGDCATGGPSTAPTGCVHESVTPLFSNILKVVVKK